MVARNCAHVLGPDTIDMPSGRCLGRQYGKSGVTKHQFGPYDIRKALDDWHAPAIDLRTAAN